MFATDGRGQDASAPDAPLPQLVGEWWLKPTLRAKTEIQQTNTKLKNAAKCTWCSNTGWWLNPALGTRTKIELTQCTLPGEEPQPSPATLCYLFCLLPEAMILGQQPYFHINFAFCWLPHGCPGNCQSNAWLHRCKVFWGAASLLFDKLRCNQRQMHRCCHNHCTFKTDFDLKLHQHPTPQCTNFTFFMDQCKQQMHPSDIALEFTNVVFWKIQNLHFCDNPNCELSVAVCCLQPAAS